MKKSNSIIAIIGLAILATAVAFVSCKKEKQEQAMNNEEQGALCYDNMDEYLMSFKKKLLSAQKGEETISLEQAQRDLGNLLNFDFGDANYATDVLQHDTLYIKLGLNYDQVDLSQLAETYTDAKNQIKEIYKKVELPEKSVYSISCAFKENLSKEDNSLMVETIVVSRGYIGENSSSNSLSWRPTYKGGTCDGNYIGIWGAPNELKARLDNNLGSYACENGRIYFTDHSSSYLDAYNDSLYVYPHGYNGYMLYVSWTEPSDNCITPSIMQYFYNNAVLLRQKKHLFTPVIPSNHVVLEHYIDYRYYQYYPNGGHSLPYIWRYIVDHAKPNCTTIGPEY